MSEKKLQAHLNDAERQRCEVWTRVMGYHRPVSEFNPGKQSEHGERRHFAEPCPASAAGV
ncbi:MAG: anaerobic ribonucleoside triphosphate reductase [Rhodocyclaceae bacterium]|nr:MAG: anaerobic ribonucleoside triphosphate reductase [Rhodocyclaceae bacterium]